MKEVPFISASSAAASMVLAATILLVTVIRLPVLALSAVGFYRAAKPDLGAVSGEKGYD